MKQQQVVKTSRRPVPASLDLRTPSGRPLKF
jgi:hypothetical protein